MRFAESPQETSRDGAVCVPTCPHGYKVIGGDPALLLYATSRFHDTADEGRISHDDDRLNYDWTVQHK